MIHWTDEIEDRPIIISGGGGRGENRKKKKIDSEGVQEREARWKKNMKPEMRWKSSPPPRWLMVDP